MAIQIKLKAKYRRGGGGDYYAPKHGINGDHNNPSWRKKTGPKTYDPKKHVLYVLANGKKRMVHL